MFGELIDEAIKLSKDNKNEVFFLTCDAVNKMCMSNRMGSKPVCKMCKHLTMRLIKKYGLRHVSLESYATNKTSICFSYSNSEDFRGIQYRYVSIGLSIMSSYMSVTRNMNPKMDDKSRAYFDQHLTQNVRFVDALYNAIDDISPDCICSYNGRYEEVRPIYDICKFLSLEFKLYEVVKRDEKWYKTVFDNSLPHDIKENTRRREYCWSNYTLLEDEKVELGKSFFEKRRYGEFSGDKKIYVANQKEGYGPSFKLNKTNVAIFNSSEDEFAAVGEDWDSLKIFKTQLDGIIYLLKNANKSIHFYLRVHPNLKDVKYKYHLELNNLEDNYSNITLIPAYSNMSTYTLMENVDKVIVFGSTMGLESVYWGKPSILLGPSLYYYDKICHTPKSKNELLDLLNQDLEVPADNINILKQGAYILNKDPLLLDIDTRYKYVDFNTKEFLFFGKKFWVTPYINLFFNSRLTGLTISILRALFDNMIFRRFILPLEEE